MRYRFEDVDNNNVRRASFLSFWKKLWNSMFLVRKQLILILEIHIQYKGSFLGIRGGCLGRTGDLHIFVLLDSALDLTGLSSTHGPR